MQCRELVLGLEGWGSWVLVGAWGLGLLELVLWDRRDLAGMVVAVVVAAGISWDLVARSGVGVVPRAWGLVELVEGWSRFAGDIFLLWRCLRANGLCQVVVWMVAEAGMCLRVANGTTSLMFWVRCREIVSTRND
jgi:hypothetical protein